MWKWKRCLLAWEEERIQECSALLHNIVMQVGVLDR